MVRAVASLGRREGEDSARRSTVTHRVPPRPVLGIIPDRYIAAARCACSSVSPCRRRPVPTSRRCRMILARSGRLLLGDLPRGLTCFIVRAKPCSQFGCVRGCAYPNCHSDWPPSVLDQGIFSPLAAQLDRRFCPRNQGFYGVGRVWNSVQPRAPPRIGNVLIRALCLPRDSQTGDCGYSSRLKNSFRALAPCRLVPRSPNRNSSSWRRGELSFARVSQVLPRRRAGSVF